MAIQTTANRGYPWPDGDDPVAQGDDRIRDLAQAVDVDVAGLSARVDLAVTGEVSRPGHTHGSTDVEDLTPALDARYLRVDAGVAGTTQRVPSGLRAEQVSAGSLVLSSGAGAGRVLMSDAVGNASWGAGVPGPAGPAGAQGPVGPQGVAGVSPVLTAGAVSTLAPGSAATAQVSPVSPGVYQLLFGVPQGERGERGEQGPVGPAGATGVVSASSPLVYNASARTLGLDMPVLDKRYVQLSGGTLGSGAVLAVPGVVQAPLLRPLPSGSSVVVGNVDSTTRVVVSNADTVSVVVNNVEALSVAANASTTVRGVLYAPKVGSATTGYAPNVHVDASTGLLRRSTAAVSAARQVVGVCGWGAPVCVPDALRGFGEPVVDPLRVLGVTPVGFVSAGDGVPMLGLLAEDVAAHLPVAVGGGDWDVRMVVAALVAVCRRLDERVSRIEGVN